MSNSLSLGPKRSLAASRMRGESSGALSLYATLKAEVAKKLRGESAFSESAIDDALASLFDDASPNFLALPHQYIESHTSDQIAKHVATMVAAKELARASARPLELQIAQEDADTAFFAARSLISVDSASGRMVRREADVSPAAKLERFIEARYLAQGENTSPAADLTSLSAFAAAQAAKAESVNAPASDSSSRASRPWRLQCYRSRGVLEDGSHLRLYFLQAADFVEPSPASGETRIEVLGDRRFLARTPPELRAVYQKVLTEASTRMGPAIHVEVGVDVSAGEDLDISGKREGQEVETVSLFIGHRSGSTHSYFSATPDVYRWHGLAAIAKTVETFSNGVIIFGFRLRQVDLARAAAAGGFTPSPHGFGMQGGSQPGGMDALSLSESGASSNAAASGLHRALQAGSSGNLRASNMGRHPSASVLAFSDRNGPALDALRERRAALATSRDAASNGAPPSLSDRLRDLVRDVALHFVLPRTSLTPLLTQGLLSAQEVAWAYAAWKFAYHFLSRMTGELNALNSILRSLGGDAGGTNAEAMSLLSKLRKQVQSHSFTESAILDALYRYPDAVATLYDDFAARFKPYHGPDATPVGSPVGSSGRASPGAKPLSRADISAYLRKNIKSSEDDLAIFEAFATFNASLQRTNFFRRDIVALSFRLSPPTFLDKLYADVPYAVYMVIGAEFRGFHVRFADVARGGIRLIKSASAAAYTNNVGGLFEECYSLSHTQQRKNKDLPEGGSKGVILLSLAHQDKASVAFKKYIDGLLDLMLGHARADVVDHMPRNPDGSPKNEILFLGPDENTADLMDWACEHARERGYPFWKAFTTGKSPRLGGVPHDTYGMTTMGVREFVMGVQRKLGMQARAAAGTLTKLQTGGPDGDLGSNEILQANERTISIVDGSGVAYDPDGLDQAELVRLARARRMVNEFDISKLGPRGFVVLVGETDVRLPGTDIVVPSGLALRNNFHLNALVSADLFVPCGGRPQAVNMDNVEAFLYGADPAGGTAIVPATADGGKRRARFTAIVEGANLFITQDARLFLERKGVVVVKDASANKGGVSSSSMEVLAALTLNDSEFSAHMQVPPAGPTPAFYASYVGEIQSTIADNARLEFECLWRERERTGEPISILSDKLSNKITDLSTAIEASDSLWANKPLVSAVLSAAVPRVLQELVGSIDAVLGRLPQNYQRALFGARLASRFIYAVGLYAPEFAFYEYVQTVVPTAAGKVATAVNGNGVAH